MKKILYILGLIVGILLILMAVFFYFKIYVVLETKEGIVYDGFGYEYINHQPYNPYTIWIYVFGILGVGIIGFFREKLIDKNK